MAVAGARGLIHDAVVNSVAMVSFHFLLRVFIFVPRCCRHAFLELSPCQPGDALKEPESSRSG